jgi:SsrA-binding protein
MGVRSSDTNNRNIATNRRARHFFAIDETLTAGLALLGSEVKSLRSGTVSFSDGYVEERDGELWLVGVHIKEWPFAGQRNHEPLRPRKLLLTAREVERVRKRVQEKGYTAVPLRFFLKNGWIKLEIGLGRGKRSHDKREDIKQRDARRDMQRALSE